MEIALRLQSLLVLANQTNSFGIAPYWYTFPCQLSLFSLPSPIQLTRQIAANRCVESKSISKLSKKEKLYSKFYTLIDFYHVSLLPYLVTRET